jgi:hypothetical protein
MLPLPPYNWPDLKKYPPAYVWLGWDGVNRLILRDGTIIPPPEAQS